MKVRSMAMGLGIAFLLSGFLAAPLRAQTVSNPANMNNTSTSVQPTNDLIYVIVLFTGSLEWDYVGSASTFANGTSGTGTSGVGTGGMALGLAMLGTGAASAHGIAIAGAPRPASTPVRAAAQPPRPVAAIAAHAPVRAITAAKAKR